MVRDRRRPRKSIKEMSVLNKRRRVIKNTARKEIAQQRATIENMRHIGTPFTLTLFNLTPFTLTPFTLTPFTLTPSLSVILVFHSLLLPLFLSIPISLLLAGIYETIFRKQ